MSRATIGLGYVQLIYVFNIGGSIYIAELSQHQLFS